MSLDEIIEELRVCNYSHFDQFYNETKKTVFFSIASIVKDDSIIDDLMQDTYVKFLENISKYQNKTNIKAFISTIAHNIAINHYNREKKLVHDEELFNYIPDEKKEAKSYGEIRVMELLNEEIAKIVDKPLGTVLWIYNKAMKDLKRKVEDDNEERS